ncbi:MAG: orotidine-5'-phosphate decarboxylase [Candidatus Nanopelagicales bacterium]|nr:orotidine-5'-phosphate decarboxylase [Candidatus Nanopelagicales bacterium]
MSSPEPEQKAPIAVALDTSSLPLACQWALQVAPFVRAVKVGLELYLRHGTPGVAMIREAAPDCLLFLDLKLHDIPATVAGAARSVAGLEPDYLTVHASGGASMVTAAAEALPETRVAAVTVLTSLSPADLMALGLGQTPEQLAVAWAEMAVAAGARAVVSSPREVGALREKLGDGPHLVTPGVRPHGSGTDDQRRV